MNRSTLGYRIALPGAVLLFYFLAPLGAKDAPVGIVLGLLVGLACIVVVAIAVYRSVLGLRRVDFIHILVAFELVLVAFALTYYLIAESHPGEFVNLSTRLDALYFSMTTMSTVGYGDVSAAGQVARAIVTLQLAFNVVFVGALVSLLRDRIHTVTSKGGDSDH